MSISEQREKNIYAYFVDDKVTIRSNLLDYTDSISFTIRGSSEKFDIETSTSLTITLSKEQANALKSIINETVKD